jgi:anti-sigma factor RsiW
LSFLDGDLSREDAQAFDEHLLECEQCWAAIQEDRAGRAALMSLKSPAPQGLADRVALAIEVADMPQPDSTNPFEHRKDQIRNLMMTKDRRRDAVLVAVVAIIVVVGGVLGFARVNSPASRDPAQVAAVVTMAEATSSSTASAIPTVHLVLAGQAVNVRSVRYHGQMVTVATSSRPFPMPPLSHVLAGSSHDAWMATHGVLAEYCVNSSDGKSSMLVVAKMPAAELPDVAAHLHLI